MTTYYITLSPSFQCYIIHMSIGTMVPEPPLANEVAAIFRTNKTQPHAKTPLTHFLLQYAPVTSTEVVYLQLRIHIESGWAG